MGKFKLKIQLSNGDEVFAKVDARNENEALQKLKQSEQYKEFAQNNDVVSLDVEKIPINPIEIKRYSIQAIQNKRGWCVCIDKEKGLRIEWKKGEYNEKQNIHFSETLPPLESATALREIGEFLQTYFPELTEKRQ